MADQQPLTPAQIAAELCGFVKTNNGSSGAHRLSYDLYGATKKTEPASDLADCDVALPNPSTPGPETGERYIWRCSSCGRKMTQSQIGKPIAAATLLTNGRRMTACPWCDGVAYNQDDDRRIREGTALVETRKAQKRKQDIIYMSVAVLLFLGLPACFGFLVLVVSSITVGPFARLDTSSKMVTLFLACSCISALIFMGFGLIVPGNWLFGYVVFIACYVGVILTSLAISYVIHKVSDGIGNLIFRC